jgi:hypothetical protein
MMALKEVMAMPLPGLIGDVSLFAQGIVPKIVLVGVKLCGGINERLINENPYYYRV